MKIIVKRRVTREGRVNVPIDILNLFGIKYNDYVDVSYNESEIVIKKLPDKKICSVTNKIFPKNELTKIGEMMVSEEGLSIIEEYIKNEKS